MTRAGIGHNTDRSPPLSAMTSVTFPADERGTADGRLIERSPLHSSIIPTLVPSQLSSGERMRAVFDQAGPSSRTGLTERNTSQNLGVRFSFDNLKPEAFYLDSVENQPEQSLQA